ncbi:Pseudouridine-5'-phosphatase [Halotydeus destructor]|nr:Pseudouridine-5'-phosphatase [Halotydeus destructor]
MLEQYEDQSRVETKMGVVKQWSVEETIGYHPVTHVIFDFDGLLVDTETVYTKATVAVASSFGKDFTWTHKAKCLGLTPRDASLKIIELLELPLHLDEFMARMDIEINAALHEVDLMPGVEVLVKHLHDHQVPMAIATGSTAKAFAKKTALPLVRHLFDKGYFEHCVFAGDDPEVKKGKPAPDCFVIAAKRFASPPEAHRNVLVFEDSPAGVHGALLGGMQCVMVPDRSLVVEVTPTAILESLELFEPHAFNLPPFRY